MGHGSGSIGKWSSNWVSWASQHRHTGFILGMFSPGCKGWNPTNEDTKKLQTSLLQGSNLWTELFNYENGQRNWVLVWASCDCFAGIQPMHFRDGQLLFSFRWWSLFLAAFRRWSTRLPATSRIFMAWRSWFLWWQWDFPQKCRTTQPPNLDLGWWRADKRSSAHLDLRFTNRYFFRVWVPPTIGSLRLEKTKNNGVPLTLNQY